jgi:small ligand-binding sensory domain FIST
MFSCVVRRMLLGSQASTEVALARTELGPSVPLAGLYCFGEIGPIAGVSSSRYLNSTFVTLLLGT